MIHLDTSFLVRALASGTPQDERLRAWIEGGESLGMSAGRGHPRAHLYNESGRRRGSLADCMIAAAAIRSGAPLATLNPRDFRRFLRAGLKLAAA